MAITRGTNRIIATVSLPQKNSKIFLQKIVDVMHTFKCSKIIICFEKSLINKSYKASICKTNDLIIESSGHDNSLKSGTFDLFA